VCVRKREREFHLLGCKKDEIAERNSGCLTTMPQGINIAKASTKETSTEASINRVTNSQRDLNFLCTITVISWQVKHIASRKYKSSSRNIPQPTHRLRSAALYMRVLFLSIVHVCILKTAMQLCSLKHVIINVFVIINIKWKGLEGFFLCVYRDLM
jgi:hypothetical protein